MAQDRPRQWQVRVPQGRGGSVFLTHFALLEPGEELTEDPPQLTLTWAEWEARHAEFGLDVDGQRLAAT